MTAEETIQQQLTAKFPALADKVRVQRARRMWAEIPTESFEEIFRFAVEDLHFPILCTITGQVKDRLKRIYDQMPSPKFVVAVGTCACSGGVFQGCYNVEGGIDQAIPVNAYIPGCAARPEAIIDGVVKLLSSLNPKPVAAPPPEPVADVLEKTA